MTTTQDNDIITRLNAHIESELKPVDREARFDDMLDECYSFEKVGGPFANMSPSSVLKEVDPIAYRCGVNDWADSESWVEINGDYYDQDEAEKAKQEFLDELEAEASEIEKELDAETDDDEPDAAVIAQHEADLAAKQAEIAVVEKHSF